MGLLAKVMELVRVELLREDRCVYCGLRRDRLDGTFCQGRYTVAVGWHMFPDGSRDDGTGHDPIRASLATAEELADAADEDD